MTRVRYNILYLIFFLLGCKEVYSQTSSSDFIALSNIQDSLENPLRIAVDKWNNIFVTDVFKKCIRKFDKNGNLITTLAQGTNPLSVAVNPEGTLFFGDANTGHIYKLNADGQPEIFYTGTVYPSSITFSPDNTLYIADNQLRKVLAVDLSGNLTREIGTGTFIFPTGIAFDTKNNRLLVAEHGGIGGDMSGCGGSFGSGPLVKVYLFDQQGNFAGSFGCFGNSNGKFYRAQGITVGRCGNIYLCEPYQGSINVYNSSGTFITKFGVFGTSEDQLNLPMDIAFDSEERIIISNYNNGSLLFYSINDVLPSASITTPDIALCEGAAAAISVKLTGTSPWNITYTRNGTNPVTISNILESPYIINVQEAGDYVITAVADANATGTCFSGAAHVSYHPMPTSTIHVGDQYICSGDSALIPVSFTGDAPWTFTYTRNGSNPLTISTTNNPYQLKVTEEGRYEIIALTGRGCAGNIFMGSPYVTVKPKPSATITTGNIRINKCGDETVFLPVALTGSAPWTFTYKVDEKNPVQVQTSENLFMLKAEVPGSYEISTVNDNYCSSNNTDGYPDVVFLEKPKAIPQITKLDLCPQTQGFIPIGLTGSAPWTFTISRNGIDPLTISTYDNEYLFPVSEQGIYSITAVTDSFCSSGLQPISFTINFIQPPSATYKDSVVQLCENLNTDIVIYFTGTAPWNFTLLKNGTDIIKLTSLTATYNYPVNTTGTYKLISLNDANCSATSLPNSLNVIAADNAVADFTYKAKGLRVKFTNTSTNAASYLWQFGDNTTSTANNPTHDYTASGVYTVTLYAYSKKCGYNAISKQVMLDIALSSEVPQSVESNNYAVQEAGKEKPAFKVFPNPNNGLFTMEASGICSGNVEVEIINMTGQVIRKMKLNIPDYQLRSGVFRHQLDMRPCSKGMYLILVRCGNKTMRQLISVTGD